MSVANNDIKQKIILEGEQEYNRALKDARRNLKTLKSELKAETAELGNNATAQQKNEARIKSLQKQIKEQEKIVKTYKDALDQVKEKYSDNEDAIAKWEQKLNYARESLAKMKNELEGVGDEFRDVQNSADMATVASKSVADTLERLSGIGGAISDGIESAFFNLLNTAKETVQAIWGDIVDLAARSNNLVDLAGFWNTDVTTIQKYAGAVAEVSGTLEDLNTLVTKINSGDSKKIAELTGVSSANYKDQWEYAMAVMDAMSKMSKENRNEVAFDIFGGRQATKAFDILNDWENLLAHLDKYDASKEGYGLSEEELQTMSDLYDKVNGLKQSWQSLKDMATVKLFGSLSMDITGNAQAIVDAFLKYFNADSPEDRKAALDEIEENILEMFTKAKEAIEAGIAGLEEIATNLKNSDNPTAQALGNILDGIVRALKWFTEDNMNNVVKAFNILATFWIAGRGAQLIGALASFAKDIATIKTFRNMNFGTGGINGATGATTMGNAISAAIQGSSGALANAIATALTSTAGVVSVGIMMIAPTVARLLKGEDPEVKKAQELSDKMTPGLDDQIQNATVNGKTALHALFGVKEPEEEVKVPGKSFWDSYIDWLNDGQEALNKIGEFFEEKKSVLEEADQFYYDDNWSIEDILNDLNQRDDWSRDGGNAGNTDGMTSTDAKDMTGAVRQMPAAVAKAVGGLTVKLDGATVGRIVAPYVSREIAHGISG